MTTKDIYSLAVRMGAMSDLRGVEQVKKYLERIRKQYEALSEQDKVEFDAERLVNPYSDSRVLVDNNKGEIKRVLAGIDMETPELLLADRLGGIDLVIAHHPEGKALLNLHDNMKMMAQIYAKYGVPINIAESVNKERIEKVSRSTYSENYNRVGDAAKLLGLDFMCTHSTADNLVARYLLNTIKDNEFELDTVGDIVNLLKTIPEYEKATQQGFAPRIFVGDKENSCGKIIVDFTGGTSPADEIYEKISQAGIGTIVTMHMSEKSKAEAVKHHLNIVIANHMASDSLGMNLFLDELEKQGVEVITTSGILRHKRF